MKRNKLFAVSLAVLLLLSALGCRLVESLQDHAFELPSSQNDTLPSEISALFPDAVSVRKTEIEAADGPYGDGRFGSTYIVRTEIAEGAKGVVIGYAIVVTNHNAYNPPLTLAVGITPDGKTTGIHFLELNEVPGKGMQADEPAFRDQFSGRIVDAFVLNEPDENGVDAISGATVTSKAVVNAVNAGLDFYRAAIAP